MSEIITLSSDEDEELPRKKIKPSPVKEVSFMSKGKQDSISDIVVLSDDELDDTNRKQHCSEVITDTTDKTVVIFDIQSTKDDKEIEESEFGNNCKDVANAITNDENSSSGKENKPEDNLSRCVDYLSIPSSSTISTTGDTLLENFLNVCEENIVNSQYEDLIKKFPHLRKYYKKCSLNLRESQCFINLLEENTSRARKSAATSVISFNDVLQFVKSVHDDSSVEVSEEHRKKLKKLEKTMKLLLMRIKQLEESEVNFDEEEDSAYLQMDRYINRLHKVHSKLCELLKKNPYSGRITYEKLDFVDSEYNEINRAISKKYKNGKIFPSYYEMENFIRKVTSEHNLVLSETKIKSESLLCFKKLGELLQNRRKRELYDAHYVHVKDTNDPAKADIKLDSTLKQNFVDAQNKIEKICEEFRIKEELGEEAVLSEDSSKSEDSECEETN